MQLVDVAMTGTGRNRRGSPGSTQLRPRRGPRAEEITLMRTLVAGPRAVTSGPIGRCVKRDWCRAVVADDGEGGAGRSTVVFALTELGRALIGGA